VHPLNACIGSVQARRQGLPHHPVADGRGRKEPHGGCDKHEQRVQSIACRVHHGIFAASFMILMMIIVMMMIIIVVMIIVIIMMIIFLVVEIIILIIIILIILILIIILMINVILIDIITTITIEIILVLLNNNDYDYYDHYFLIIIAVLPFSSPNHLRRSSHSLSSTRARARQGRRYAWLTTSTEILSFFR
jgi:hypothetical protein